MVREPNSKTSDLASIILLMISMSALTTFSHTWQASADQCSIQVANPVLKSASGGMSSVIAGQQIVIATTITNFCTEESLPFVAIIEARNSEGVTESLALQSGVLEGIANSTEVEASWIPSHADSYQLRAFIISNMVNPQVLSDVMAAIWDVEESVDGSDGTQRRETAIYALLASDPRLAKYREGVYGHVEDFSPLRREPSGAWIDEASMHVIKEQVVEGDWETGYNVTYKGVTEVQMEIKSAREILTIKEIPLPDSKYQYTFNEQDKAIIRAALDNATARQTLESKEVLGHSTFVTTVAYNGYFTSSETLCPPGKCGRVHFQVEDTKQVMIVWLNTDTHVVARIDLSMEWKQDCRQFDCKES